MRSWKNKWGVRLAALGLACACLCGGAVLAVGDEEDPLITLSYLTEQVTPEILNQVEENADERQELLQKEFQDAVEEYQQQLDRQQSQSHSGSFTAVTLNAGEVLALGNGCEVVLQGGSAVVASDSEPALLDVTNAGSLANGGSLTVNHMYIAPAAGRSLNAGAGGAVVLVRGSTDAG